MSKKVVLVTGATRGLGLATAIRLKSDGFYVLATGRSLSAELEGHLGSDHVSSGELTFLELDLENTENLHTFVKKAVSKHGNLYGLVNNAAVAHDGVLATLHDSQIQKMINVNIFSTILLTKYAIRSMLLNGEGRIVNVSSIVSSTGFNGLSVYAATKSSLIGFTKSLARELGRANITVNALAPGYMETEMSSGLTQLQLDTIVRRTPLKQLVTVNEVAGSVSFLMGKDAAMITGSVLTVDGGSSA
jgi:3-oxoacyl-[acyl-carrier protein] reductase